MYERLLVEMGKEVVSRVASITKLEKEILEIEQGNLNNCKNTCKVIAMIVKAKGSKQLVAGSNTHIQDPKLKKIFKKHNYNTNLRNILNSTEIPFNLKFEAYLSYIVNEAKKGTGNRCIICNHSPAISYSGDFKLSNPSDYSMKGTSETVCLKHYLYITASSLYPKILTRDEKFGKSDYYYKVLSDGSIQESIMFSKNLNRYIKKRIIENRPSRTYILFYKPEGQNSNLSILGIGELNIIKSLMEMIKNKYTIDNFKVFLESTIVKDQNYSSRYIPIFLEMIQNDYIPTEMYRHFIHVFREHIGENSGRNDYFYVGDLNRFYSFSKDYLKVKNMVELSGSLKEGYGLGKKIISSLENPNEREQVKKWITSMSSLMEMSDKEFLKGIVSIERKIRTEIYTKGMSEIAKNEKRRIAFITGLLSGIYSSKGDKYGEE